MLPQLKLILHILQCELLLLDLFLEVIDLLLVDEGLEGAWVGQVQLLGDRRLP